MKGSVRSVSVFRSCQELLGASIYEVHSQVVWKRGSSFSGSLRVRTQISITRRDRRVISERTSLEHNCNSSSCDTVSLVLLPPTDESLSLRPQIQFPFFSSARPTTRLPPDTGRTGRATRVGRKTGLTTRAVRHGPYVSIVRHTLRWQVCSPNEIRVGEVCQRFSFLGHFRGVLKEAVIGAVEDVLLYEQLENAKQVKMRSSRDLRTGLVGSSSSSCDTGVSLVLLPPTDESLRPAQIQFPPILAPQHILSWAPQQYPSRHGSHGALAKFFGSPRASGNNPLTLLSLAHTNMPQTLLPGLGSLIASLE